MSTLGVVEEILRRTGVPMSVREVVEKAGARLPTKSKTPDTVVARDLSMDIKKKGEASAFIRTAPGRYTMRDFVQQSSPSTAKPPSPEPRADDARPILASALSQDRAAPLPATTNRSDDDRPAVVRGG